MRGQRLSRDGSGRDNNPLHTKPTCTRVFEVVRRMIVASSELYHPTLDNFELQSVRLGELISLSRLTQCKAIHLIPTDPLLDLAVRPLRRKLLRPTGWAIWHRYLCC